MERRALLPETRRELRRAEQQTAFVFMFLTAWCYIFLVQWVVLDVLRYVAAGMVVRILTAGVVSLLAVVLIWIADGISDTCCDNGLPGLSAAIVIFISALGIAIGAHAMRA